MQRPVGRFCARPSLFFQRTFTQRSRKKKGESRGLRNERVRSDESVSPGSEGRRPARLCREAKPRASDHQSFRTSPRNACSRSQNISTMSSGRRLRKSSFSPPRQTQCLSPLSVDRDGRNLQRKLKAAGICPFPPHRRSARHGSTQNIYLNSVKYKYKCEQSAPYVYIHIYIYIYVYRRKETTIGCMEYSESFLLSFCVSVVGLYS
ncbi:hypothetical protein TGARI_301280, partial [Toxoplasma gondii ARI]